MEKFSPEKQAYQPSSKDIEKAEELIIEEQKAASKERQTSFEAGEKHGKREMIKDLLKDKSKRTLLEGMAKLSDQLGQPEQAEKPKELEKEISFEKAQEIMGKDFLGPEAVKNVFGVEVESIPPIQFTKEDLERAKELNQMLILQIDKMEDDKPLTLENLKNKFSESHDGKQMWDSYNKKENFFKNETPKAGWKLASKDIISDSTRKNYLEQTKTIINYLKDKVFKGKLIPEMYQKAIAEFESKESDISGLINSDSIYDWKSAAIKLEKLQITQLTRESPIEVMYRFVLQDQENKEKLLYNVKSSWTSRLSSDGDQFVSVGRISNGDGVNIHEYTPVHTLDIGVFFSRSL